MVVAVGICRYIWSYFSGILALPDTVGHTGEQWVALPESKTENIEKTRWEGGLASLKDGSSTQKYA
jgi:hypothetical protein